MSKLAELQAKKNAAADKIRNLGAEFTANGKKWKDGGAALWEATNKEYDEAAASINSLGGEINVDARLAEINRLQNGPRDNFWPYDDQRSGVANGTLMPPRGDQNQPARERVMFKDMASGRMLPALFANEALSQYGRAAAGHDEEQSPDVGDLLHSMLTGRAQNITPSQYRNAIGSSDSAGGYILDVSTSQRVIDLARSASVALRAGALTMPMDAREMAIARITQEPTAMWRAEGVGVTGSTMAFDSVTLRAKTLAAIVPVTIELLEDSSNAGRIITQAIQAALGLELDRVALMGGGTAAEPRGIRNQVGVNSITAVGAPAYADITAAIGDIYGANYAGDASSLAWVMNPREAEKFDGLLDSTGQPLQPTPWAAAVQKLTTTSLSVTEGGGSNESSMIVGDFSQVVIGMRTSGANVRILDAGQVTDADAQVHDAAPELKKLIVAYLRADVAVLRPTWMTVLSGVTA